jgi:hypothetical protein
MATERRAHGPEHDAAAWVSQRWLWLGRLLSHKRTVSGVDIDGFSANFNGARWLVIVRGLNAETVEYKVAFGSAERLYDALRNVTSSIGKGEWKEDKFRHFLPGVYDTKAPLTQSRLL